MEMTTTELPRLSRVSWRSAVDGMHACSRVLGALRAALAPHQKHWWHASLSLHARGVTTGPMQTSSGALEARIDFLDGHVALLDSRGHAERWYLTNMPAGKLAELVSSRARDWGVAVDLDPEEFGPVALGEGSQRDCQDIFTALLWFDGLLKAFKARQRRETSPVQLWPHHFDVALLWLSGRQIPDHDPVDEETADEQMNFGFALGTGEERPYFYVTCYPQAQGFPGIELPDIAVWNDDGWQGVRIYYDSLRALDQPFGRMLELLETLRSNGEAALSG